MTRLFLDGFALRFPRTGVVNYIYNIASLMNGDPRMDVTVLLGDLNFADNAVGELAKSMDHRLVCDGLSERLARKSLGALWNNPAMPLPLPGIVTKVTDPCDVYHATDLYFQPSAKAKKNIITIYDLTTVLFPEYHEALNIEKDRLKGEQLAKFDHIVAISNSTRNDIVEHFKVPEERISVLPCGVDSVYEAPVFLPRDELTNAVNIPQNMRYILSVSTIEPRKNIIGALEAFRIFATRNPSLKDVGLVLCGPMGWSNQSLQNYLKSYPFSDRVIFSGYVPLDLMPSLYRHAELFIYLSFYEGFGIPILEAMKSGCPVICGNNSSLTEVIGDCGLTVSAHAPKDACDAIEAMLTNAELSSRCREMGALRAKEMTWERHADGLKDIYGVGPAEYASKSKAVPQGVGAPDDARYQEWVVRQNRTDQAERAEIERHISAMIARPHLTIYVDGEDGAARDATLTSLDRQVYSAFSVADAKAVTEKADDPGLFVYLRAGDQLHWRALYECASAYNADPTLEVITFDEDVMAADGTRSSPYFKPEWSPDLLEATNYIGSAACYALPPAQQIFPTSSNLYDFVLRFMEADRSTKHVRRVLLHRSASTDAPIAAAQAEGEMAALAGRLARTRRNGCVAPAANGYGCYHVALAREREPLVSIVIPTAGRVVDFDGMPHDMIVSCVGAIDRRTTYSNYEYVIVDNGDFDRNRLDHIYARPIRYVTFEDEIFNLSKKLALGAAKAAGPFLILLNDDIEVITPNWIERMLDHFAKPHVGLVGAKLLYPDMRIQHAGVVSSMGHFKHVNGHLKRDDPGRFFSNLVPRNYLGVTGAVTMTRADLFCELGGYDEAMPIWANDLDYALKMRKRNRTVVYDPSIELIHFEKGSLQENSNASHEELLYKRWGYLTKDPYYNAHMMLNDYPEYRFSPAMMDI